MTTDPGDLVLYGLVLIPLTTFGLGWLCLWWVERDVETEDRNVYTEGWHDERRR